MTQTLFCGQCGEPMVADTRFCGGCGAHQQTPAAARTGERLPPGSGNSATLVASAPIASRRNAPAVQRARPDDDARFVRAAAAHEAKVALPGPRLVAHFIDSLAVTLAMLPFLVLMLDGAEVGPGAIAIGAIFMLLLVFYAPLLMMRPGLNNGQTLGKQVMGIRVVRLDGRQVTFGSALFRDFVMKGFVFGPLSLLLLYVPTLVNALWPLFNERHRALHDKAARTLVVRA